MSAPLRAPAAVLPRGDAGPGAGAVAAGPLDRGAWVEAVLAALATFAAGWPITALVREDPWLWPLAGVLAVVVLVGGLVRSVGAKAWVTVTAQVVLVTLALAWLTVRDALWHGLPGTDAVRGWIALVAQGAGTIRVEAVPAPATPGLTFLVLAGLAAAALVVDAIGVTARAPALAGVPLLLLGAITASNTGEPLHPVSFLAPALAWLLLLSRQGTASIRAWAGTASARTSVDVGSAVAGSAQRYGSTARRLGVLTLLLAVALPAALPHLPPTALVDGLARAGGAGGDGTVTFTETLDLSVDLASRSQAPVLRYRADERTTPPLRVTVTSSYVDGRWEPTDRTATPTVPFPPVPFPIGLDPTLDVQPSSLTVLENGLRAPQVAVPHPLVSADFGRVAWGVDPTTQTAVLADHADSYEVAYLRVDGLAVLPEHVGSPDAVPEQQVVRRERQEDGTVLELGADDDLLAVVEPDGRRVVLRPDGGYTLIDPDGDVVIQPPPGVGPETLAVDPAARERVEALAAEVVGDRTNEVDIARAIQEHLRSPLYTYSLTLADPVPGPGGEPLDPLSHFLETRQGYCTQFATAMIMMARSQGIPARLAIGFLAKAESEDGTRTVVAGDAHAWPELFISNLGWTRFEPTPGERSGPPPLYLTPSQLGAGGAVPDPTVGNVAPTAAPQVDVDAGASTGDAGWVGDALRQAGWVALVLAGVAAVLAVVPTAGWWYRQGWRRRARTDADLVEGEWHVLTTSLADLGVPVPEGRTLRQARAHYEQHADLDPASATALARVAERVETARYAPGGAPPGTISEDVRRVVERRRATVPRSRRLLAGVWPRSGTEQLRRTATALSALGRGIVDLVTGRVRRASRHA